MTVTVKVSLELLGERWGIWCERCALPSALECHFMLMFDGKPDHIITSRACTECEEQDGP